MPIFLTVNIDKFFDATCWSMQRTIDGKNYYFFEYILTSPNFSTASFASIAIANGKQSNNLISEIMHMMSYLFYFQKKRTNGSWTFENDLRIASENDAIDDTIVKILWLFDNGWQTLGQGDIIRWSLEQTKDGGKGSGICSKLWLTLSKCLISEMMIYCRAFSCKTTELVFVVYIKSASCNTYKYCFWFR